VDIHFIHVRSEHEDALPLVVTHGWPGSTVDQLKIIGPLSNPTEHGASAADAFDLVIPSLPGYGFSGRPAETGWDPIRIARAWVVLMERLGYARYVAQGGDWGNAVAEQMACSSPRGCWASTRTCRRPFRPTCRRRWPAAVRSQTGSHPTRTRRTRR
jgi:pimeloyl-ACP methyl ester carboxylesterase